MKRNFVIFNGQKYVIGDCENCPAYAFNTNECCYYTWFEGISSNRIKIIKGKKKCHLDKLA